MSHIPPCSFSASLLGKTTTIQQGTPRQIRVEFKPPHAGTFHAALRITFSSQTRQNHQDWIVTRELRGRAILPASAGPVSNGDTPNTEMVDDELEYGGITVFPHFALDFSVELLQSNEPFPTQTKDLIITITKSSTIRFVSFAAARVYSPDTSMAE